jgi:ABC-type multidrug transport system fused ATPase/permease subunit
VLKSALSFVLTRRAFRFLANRQALVSGSLAAELLSRPLIRVQQRSSQEAAYALTAGVNAATLGVVGSGVVIASEAALILVLTAGLLVIDLWITVFTLVFFTAIGLILNKLLSGWASRLGEDASEAEVASYTSIQEVLRTYREVTVTGRRTMYVQRFQHMRWQAARVQADIQVMSQVSKYVFEVALIVGGGLLALSQLFSKDAAGAVAVIAVFLAAASRMMPSLLRLQQATLTIRMAAGIAATAFALRDELACDPAHDASRLTSDATLHARVAEGLRSGHPDFVSSIQLADVEVWYPDAQSPAIQAVSLAVPAGGSLAIVGSTGAGKSTLADLILGVLLPDGGSVAIGGRSPSLAISEFPGAITYVPQDISIINGTIRDNVALGLPPDLVLEDRVWEALARSQLALFLRDQRDGLDTVVGESGVRLSGGQRQRLGLARALYSRPKMIVLDEATSALDAETEQSVSDALANLEGEVTLVIIAHRLATIRHCDQVAYLSGGELRAIGTFDEVRSAEPSFNLQAHLLGL